MNQSTGDHGENRGNTTQSTSVKPKRRKRLREIGGKLTGIQPGTIRTRRQLLDGGMTRLELERALANGTIARVERGRYRFEVSGLRTRMGLVLAAAPDAVFSHRVAAHLHGLRKREPDYMDVVVPPSRRDVAGCLTRRRESVQVNTIDGVPVTSLAEPLVDLLELWGPEAVADALDRKLPTVASRSSLLHDLEELPAHQRNRLRPLVEWAPERRRSLKEGRLARALNLRGYEIELNQWIGPYEWDVVHVAARLVIEFDSKKFHMDEDVFREDRARQNNVVRRGFAILRYTDDDLWLRFDEVITEISRTIDQLLGGPRVEGEWDVRRCRDLYFERWDRMEHWERDREWAGA